MTVSPIVPDVATPALSSPASAKPAAAAPAAFAKMVDDAGAAFRKADQAEDAFAAGSGSLQAAIYDRARADVALAVAAAAAQRAAQALQSIFSMQV